MKEKDNEFINDLITLLKKHKRSLRVVTIGKQSWILSGDLVLSRMRLTTTKLKKLLEDEQRT